MTNEFIWVNRHQGSGQFFDLAGSNLEEANALQLEISMADIALAYLNYGNTAWNRSEPEIAFNALQKAQQLFRNLGDFGKAGFAEAVMSNLHSQKGEFEKAFALIYKIIDELQDQDEHEVLGLSFLSAGSFHFDLESYEEAFQYFHRSFESFQNIRDEIGIARSMNNAGMSLHKLGRNEEGLEYCEKSLQIYERLNLDQGRAKAKRDIGKILGSKGNLKEALDYFKQSLEIREKAHTQKSSGIDGIITCHMDIGEILNRMGRTTEANDHLKKALLLSEASNSLPKLIKIEKLLSDTSKMEGDYEDALKHLETHLDLKKEMLGQETENKIKMMQTRYALELANKAADMEKTKNEELNLAYQKINIINRNLTDSLKYAKRIQTAFLPTMQRFKITFPQSYILNLPKDIVSGDFFWMSQKNGFHLLAVGDCSGHGVPGAFMSMVGISLLNQIVNERGVLQPGKILNQLNLALINNLNEMKDENTVEGIDISLCVFDSAFTHLVYAGARRPLYYFEKGYLKEIKATPASIGFDPYTDFNEKCQRLDLEGIDQLVLSTDGYADQFGEANGKKLMVNKFRELLMAQSKFGPDAQESFLRDYFFAWKGKEHQTDDVLVVGIKL